VSAEVAWGLLSTGYVTLVNEGLLSVEVAFLGLGLDHLVA
jgi:hypothetical protein